MRQILPVVLGLSFGLFTAGAAFTAVVVIGLVPRFTARFNAAKRVFLFENSLMAGVIAGSVIGVYGDLI